MAQSDTISLDHIDPRWKDGRDYQLVCGFSEGPLAENNEVLTDHGYNSRKVNRFVPYRVCDYPAPILFGDTGEFLIQGEWVVCEFGGEIWWEESNKVGNSQNVQTEKRRKGYERKVGTTNPEHSVRMTGEGNPMYGRPLSEEAQARRIEKITNKKATQETKDKMSATRRGVSKSAEHKAKIAEGVRRARARVKQS